MGTEFRMKSLGFGMVGWVLVLSGLLIGCVGGQHTEPAWPEEGVTLWFGGDVHVDSDPHTRLSVLSTLVKGGVGFINLEAPVGENAGSKRRGGKIQLTNHPGILPTLANAGVKVVGLENNHRLDHGEQGYALTRKFIEDAGLRAHDRRHSVTLDVQGIKVGYISRWLDEDDALDDLREELGALRPKVDILIASYHVNSRSYLTSPRAKDFEAIAADQHVDLVVGHGSHRFGPAYRRGTMLVAHGLGNLLFDCECTKEREALLLQVHWASKGVVEAKLIPIEAGLLGKPLNASSDAERTLRHLKALGTPLKTRGTEAGFF